MSIDVKKITDEQKDRILNLAEGHFYEVKGKEIQPRKCEWSFTNIYRVIPYSW
jgi:hypothetical protein